jgi:hypothetical protein
MRFLILIKPLLLLVAALFGILIGARQVYIFLSEKQPTAFTAENFAAEYGGEQWISVTGRLAVEELAEMPGRGGRVASFYVPLVPRDWQRQEPVHVVAAPSRVPVGGVNAWAQAVNSQEQVTVTGTIRPLGGLNYGYVFPRLKFARPTVTINENTQPHPPWGMGFFLAICLVLCVFASWRVASALRT